MESELDTLYQNVEADFRTFYRAIHGEDEANFTAKLTPSAGQLDFKVDFYGRDPFPPTAYHSEGHQDSMGVCLYLALRKHQLGADFTFAMLDDVLTSVDLDHRRQFCALLRDQFPNTQFVITTHDEVWAKQMASAGLVTKKTSFVIQNWNVDIGPVAETATDIWEDIEAALAQRKVPVAAALLRRHLEFAFRDLADSLGADVRFRADGRYELGHLRDSAMARLDKLYGYAKDSAHSWESPDQKALADARKASLAKARDLLKSSDAWTLNALVHYNEWANLSRQDFEPVVSAFKQILSCFQCDHCQSFLFTTNRPEHGESLRCPCDHVSFNLTAKPKTKTASSA
jgi:hypothetical protein